jgi:amidase
MHPSDFSPAFATAAETADAIRKKRISASELMNIAMQRVDRHNPALNAIVWQDREQAAARAKQADEALASGNASGALHGVPVTIKDAFAYRGSPNSWGLPPSPSSASNPPARSSSEKRTCRSCSAIGKPTTRFTGRRIIRGT